MYSLSRHPFSQLFGISDLSVLLQPHSHPPVQESWFFTGVEKPRCRCLSSGPGTKLGRRTNLSPAHAASRAPGNSPESQLVAAHDAQPPSSRCLLYSRSQELAELSEAQCQVRSIKSVSVTWFLKSFVRFRNPSNCFSYNHPKQQGATWETDSNSCRNT